MITGRLRPGDEIDGYRLVRELHRGGMAVLWSVESESEKRPLVLKAPIILDSDDATAIVGFEMEQMILPMLVGPHAPRVLAIGDFARQPYIVMEHVQGQTLLPLLEKAPLPVADVVRIGQKVAAALTDLHRQNVIHLDIKPSNIILREGTGEAVLIDYGLSHHHMMPDLLFEEFRLPMGTGPYISPEQVQRVRSDPRSDIFALGVLLYHLATGQRPFGYPRTRRALRTRLWRRPTPPRAHDRAIPVWFQEIVLRCLENDPANRYQSAAQLALDLKNPDQVRITRRGERLKGGGFLDHVRRWWTVRPPDAQRETPWQAQFALAPIVLAAVDLSEGSEVLAECVRQATERLLRTSPGVRLACLNVVKQSRVGPNYALDDMGRNIHVDRLVALKEWARALDHMAEQTTYHVLEATDPGAAIVEFARHNNVDHVVIGARASSTLRRYIGSSSSAVVAGAPCSVTVVRAPAIGDAPDEDFSSIVET